MTYADRDEAKGLRRFLRFRRLQSEICEAQRTVDARQRLELRLSHDAIKYGALSSANFWRAA